MAVGNEGGQGGGPDIPARSKKARAAPAFTPVTSASAACLPTHERLLEMLSPCLANPKPKVQEPATCQLSGGCQELSDKLQHASAHGAGRLLSGPGSWWRVSGNHCAREGR